jgi:hypothetical protein
MGLSLVFAIFGTKYVGAWLVGVYILFEKPMFLCGVLPLGLSNRDDYKDDLKYSFTIFI